MSGIIVITIVVINIIIQINHKNLYNELSKSLKLADVEYNRVTDDRNYTIRSLSGNSELLRMYIDGIWATVSDASEGSLYTTSVNNNKTLFFFKKQQSDGGKPYLLIISVSKSNTDFVEILKYLNDNCDLLCGSNCDEMYYYARLYDSEEASISALCKRENGVFKSVGYEYSEDMQLALYVAGVLK